MGNLVFRFLMFFVYFLLRLEWAVLVQTLGSRFTSTLTYSLQMYLRTYVCRAFPPCFRMFLTGTSGFLIYFEVFFAFASANLHDDGVLVLAHVADPEVSRFIHNWAHTEEFYVAKDWFDMSDLDLQSPTNPSELVFSFRNHPFSFLPYFFLLCFPNSIVHLCLQTRKFFITVLVRNGSFLNVRTSDFEDMGYNLKRDGWLNSFTDLKNQSMRDDGVPWRGAREKLP